MKKIVILAFQYPPYAEVGAYRWENLSREMAQRGQSVSVITVDWNASVDYYSDRFPGIDVKVIPSGSPHLMRYKKLKNPYLNFLKNIPFRYFIDRVFFFHDYSQRWGKHVDKTFTQIVHEHGRSNIVLIATGAPFHVNVIASELKAKFKEIRLIQDLRDVWSQNPYWTQNKKILKKIKIWEEFSLKNADTIITISETLQEDFLKLYPMLRNKMKVVSNGFDPSLKNLAEEASGIENAVLTIAHIGSVTNGREEPLFWLLDMVLKHNIPMKLELVGNLPAHVLMKFQTQYKTLIIENKLIHHPFMAREKALRILHDADFALLLNSKLLAYALSTKIYEYGLLKKPTLSLNYGGEIESFFKTNRWGISIDLRKSASEGELMSLISNLEKLNFDFSRVEEYSYRRIVDQYLRIIDSEK